MQTPERSNTDAIDTIQAMLRAPDGRQVGIMSVQSMSVRSFSRADAALLEAIGNLVAARIAVSGPLRS